MIAETQFKYELVRLYMNREIDTAIEMCRQYINNNKGVVQDDFFLMLFDMYRAKNDKIKFLKLAKTYSDLTGTIRKIWTDREYSETISNKNIFIAPNNGVLNNNETILKKIDDFCQNTIQKKFGRLDFNKIDFMQSSSVGLQKILDTLYELRKSNAKVVLMGDNKILGFNFQYFDNLRENSELSIEQKKEEQEKQNEINRFLQKEETFLSDKFSKEQILEEMLQEIDKKEEIIYLLKMEIYQWKGFEKEYIDLSLDYFSKFQKVPMDYKKNEEKLKIKYETSFGEDSKGIVGIESVSFGINTDNKNEILKFYCNEINKQNLHYLTDYLSSKNRFVIFVDFSNVDFMTYEAASELLVFMNHYRTDDKYLIHLKNVNKMIEIALNMVGLSDYLIVNDLKQ